MQYLVSVIDDTAGLATPDEMAAINAFNDRLTSEGHWAEARCTARVSASGELVTLDEQYRGPGTRHWSPRAIGWCASGWPPGVAPGRYQILAAIHPFPSRPRITGCSSPSLCPARYRPIAYLVA